MNLFEFAEQRKQRKKRLGKVECVVRECFEIKSEFIELKYINKLVRFIWARYDENISCESIARIARKLRATGEFDTEANQRDRSNLETAHHQYFKKQLLNNQN